MNNLDLRKPQRLEDEPIEDYILRYGQAVVEANKLHIAAIERMPLSAINPTTAGPKHKAVTTSERARERKPTMHDFLSTRPDLVRKHKMGLYDPFEV